MSIHHTKKGGIVEEKQKYKIKKEKIILFISQISNLPTVGSMRIKIKKREKKKKGSKGQRVKSPIPIWEIDVLIGDEEQNGKHKKEEKGRNRRRDHDSLLWIIRSPTSTRRNRTVNLFL